MKKIIEDQAEGIKGRLNQKNYFFLSSPFLSSVIFLRQLLNETYLWYAKTYFFFVLNPVTDVCKSIVMLNVHISFIID